MPPEGTFSTLQDGPRTPRSTSVPGTLDMYDIRDEVERITATAQKHQELLHMLIDKTEEHNELLRKIAGALDKENRIEAGGSITALEHRHQRIALQLVKRYAYPTDNNIHSALSDVEEHSLKEVLKKVKEDVRQIRAKLAAQVYDAIVGCVICDEEEHPLFDEITDGTVTPSRAVRRHKLTEFGEACKQDDRWRTGRNGLLSGDIFQYVALQISPGFWVRGSDDVDRLSKAICAFALMVCQLAFDGRRLGDVRSEAEKLRLFREELAYCDGITSSMLCSAYQEETEWNKN